MNHQTIKSTLATLWLICLAGYAQAATEGFHSHAAIISAVDRHLQDEFDQDGEKLTIDITPLDHRLQLPLCAEALSTFDPPGGINLGRTTVGVSCQSPKPWTLYVSANVGRELPVVVARRDIARGDPIGEEDLGLEVLDTSHLLRGHFSEVAEVAGHTSKRTLRRGQAITPSMLVVQKTIRRGEQITILSAIGPIEVRSQGKALRDGNSGDLIPVINSSSKKKLQARVLSSGMVSVD
jgi:flagellar basal body P-ring formation protein FlgA